MAKEKVLAYLDQNEEGLMDFLKETIRINSVNPGKDIPAPKEEEIAKYLAGYLEKEGFKVDMFAVDPEGKRLNVCAVLPGSKKSKDSKNLILSAHTDTVIVSEIEKWTVDPFGAEEKDGKIYGRGSNDMKGGMAAAVFAAKAIKDCGVETDGDVILMFSAGEESCEGGEIGTKACVDRGYRAPLALVCEPTSLELHNSTCSTFAFELIVHGKAIHTCCRNQVMFPQSAYQGSGEEIGVDAVEKALPFIQLFYRLEKEWNFRYKGKSAVGTGGKGGHDNQGIGVFTINPSFIESGTYIGAVPGKVKVTYAVWHPPEVSNEDVIKEIRQKVSALAQTDDWLIANPPEVIGPVPQVWPGFVTDETIAPVVQFKKSYESAMSAPPIGSGFRATCDGTYLINEGIPAIICGPGDIGDGVHGYDEFVRREEVLKAAKIYASFIYDWCG